MINWDISREHMDIVAEIVDRAMPLFQSVEVQGMPVPRRMIIMDLVACHMNGCPLDLEKLRDAPNGDFGHDMNGIFNHMNRETGQLEDCFVPRCASQESE